MKRVIKRSINAATFFKEASMNTMERLRLEGLTPVIEIDKIEHALPTADAIVSGGLNVMEITLRTEAGLGSIEKIKKERPDIILGAGTVLTDEQCYQSIEAGADFIVSPGFDANLVRICQEKNVVAVPGCVTPTEIQAALRMGLTTVKFFPSQAYGGIPTMKSLYGPFASAGIRFIPTGGINPKNLPEYASQSFIHAMGGTWFCRAADIANKEFAKITSLVKQAIDILLGFELAHVAINADSAVEAEKVAIDLNRAFGFEINDGNSSMMVDSFFELMKIPFRGTHGHVAIRTNNIDRAQYYLEKRGFKFDHDSEKIKNDKRVAIYLEDEFGGLAIHLLQK